MKLRTFIAIGTSLVLAIAIGFGAGLSAQWAHRGERSWVLWERSETLAGTSRSGALRPLRGAATQTQCESLALAEAASHAEGKPDPEARIKTRVRRNQVTQTTLGVAWLTTFYYECFGSSFDPRPWE